MKKSTRVLIAAVLAPVLSIGVLTACSSNDPAPSTAPESASSAPADPAPAASAASDEELITADLEKFIETTFTSQQFADTIRQNSDLQDLVALGFDIDAFAEDIMNLFSLDVTTVEVSGDTAIARVAAIEPVFSTEASTLMEQEMNRIEERVDVDSMTEEELMPYFMEAMSAVLSDPNFPTTTNDVKVEYVKNGDNWEMSDPSVLTSMIFDDFDLG